MTRPVPLSSENELDQVVRRSHERPVFVFKHSAICPVSSTADREFEDFVARADADAAEFHRIVIQDARPVSNAVAERTGVRHESPQALLFVDGKVVWHTSHGSITRSALGDALREATGGGA